MTNYLTAAAAMSESPLVRFLGAIAVVLLIAKAAAHLATVARNRGATTYWWRGQQITRHDYEALRAQERR